VQAELEGALPQRFGSVKLDESDSRRPLYTTCVLLKLRRDTKAEAKPEEVRWGGFGVEGFCNVAAALTN
jgi:hypothetical protein